MFQVIPVTVVFPVVHPTVSLVGRTCVVDPGPQESTAGSGATVVVVGRDVLVDTCAIVVDVPIPSDLVAGGEDLEPTVNPTAMPPPRAARMSAAIPTRTTVLRRMVMRRGSLSTITTTVVRAVATMTNGILSVPARQPVAHVCLVPGMQSDIISDLGLECHS